MEFIWSVSSPPSSLFSCPLLSPYPSPLIISFRLFLYIMIAILGIIVIPFAIFYIEAEDEKGSAFPLPPLAPLSFSSPLNLNSSQFGNACKGVAILFVVFAALYIPGYIFLAISDVLLTPPPP